jgi:autotransporter-associated beta strand protein
MHLPIGGGVAQASNGTWTGAGGFDRTWSNVGNWSGGAGHVPGANNGTYVSPDIATFNIDDDIRTVSVDANRNVGGITFDTGSVAPYTFSGSGLHLTAGGTTQMTASVTQPQTFNNDLVVEGSGAYTLTNNATSTSALLNLNGGLTFNTAGTGQLMLSGTNAGTKDNLQGILTANTIAGVIGNGSASALNVSVSGGASWIFSGANTYGGTTTVSDSSTWLALANDSALGTSTLVLNADGGGIQTIASPRTLVNDIQAAGANCYLGGSQGLTLNGSLTFTGAATWTNSTASPSRTVTLNGPIYLSNSAATPRSVSIFSQSGNGKSSNQLWINGDFDYNSNVNVADLADLAGNFGNALAVPNQTGGAGATTATAATVPEPLGGLAALLLALPPLVLQTAARRRRTKPRHRGAVVGDLCDTASPSVGGGLAGRPCYDGGCETS